MYKYQLNSLRIPKGLLEAVNRIRTYNTIAKRKKHKRTNSDLLNITPKIGESPRKQTIVIHDISCSQVDNNLYYNYQNTSDMFKIA